MVIFSSNATYPLVVFRGTTATLLRAGGGTAPPGFKAEDVVYTAELDRSSYKLVSRSPLLHTEILLAVGRQMSTRIAPQLAAEFARTGTLTANSLILKKAANDAPLWVQQAGKGQTAGLRRWRKAKVENALTCTACVMGLVSSSAGLASAAASFGATSIPAIFGAWSAVATTIGALAGAWRDVETSEANVMRHVRKMGEAYGGQLRGAPVNRGAAKKAALGGKAVANIMASNLKLNQLPFANGRSLGPSVSGFQSAINEYEAKLSHLVKEANALTAILMDLLDVDDELAMSTDPGDTAKLATNEALAVRIIGDERGTAGVSRKRDGFRGQVSILWLNSYYDVGRVIAQQMRTQVQQFQRETTMNRLDAAEQGGALAFGVGMWFAGQTEALTSGSLMAFASKVGIVTDKEVPNVTGIIAVAATLNEWRALAGGVINALRHNYPDEAISSISEDCKIEYLATSREFGLGALNAYSAVKGAVAV